MRRCTCLLAISALVTIASAEPIKRLTQPAISPDGKTIAFSWQGDIWTVPRAGGAAQRLTVHPANDTSPHWTPDGKRIVFASNRYGFFNVFSIGADGSGLKRLTFDGGNAYPYSVSPDGLYVYGQTSVFSGRGWNIFRIPITGGDLVALTNHPTDGSAQPVVTPDNKHVLFVRGSYWPTGWQKPQVRSAAMANFYLADKSVPLSNQHPIFRSEASHLFGSMDTEAHVYYVSNESGWPNLWRMNLNGSSKKELTHHSNGTMRYASVSQDGSVAAYDFESELYVLDTASGKETKLEVTVPADARDNPEQEISLKDGVDEYTISPDSKRAVIAARGDLFLLPEKGGTTRRLTTNTAWDGHPVFLDSKRVLYVSSDKGRRSLKVMTLDGQSKSFVDDDGDLVHPMLSPDAKSVAYLKNGEEILVVPAAGGTPTSILKSNFHPMITGEAVFAWSPDSKWLAIDKPTSLASSQVIAAQVGGDKRIIVARTARGAGNLRWLPNGKGIYFLSNEFPGKTDLFLVDLMPSETTFAEDDLDKLDEAKPAVKPDPVVEIQESGIDLRMRKIDTVGDPNSVVAAADSKSFYVGSAAGIAVVPVGTGPAKPLEGAPSNVDNLKLGQGGQKLYFVAAGKFYSAPLDKPGAPAAVPINATFTVNMREEERALFDEIWWTMDRFYYDPKMHGQDWKAIKQKFAAIVPFTYDRGDFYSLMGEMMEELNSSHLGSQAPAPPQFGSDAMGYTGLVFDPMALDARRSYIVRSVDPNAPADLPQSKFAVGDKVVAVDGQDLGPSNTFAGLLNKKAGKKVVIKIERDGKSREITIKPATSATQRELGYENWVAWEREHTEKLSGGKLTYLHVRAMDEASYERFLREIRTYTVGKKGVLVDVRYNGGGSTSHKLLGVMIKTPWLVRTTRGFEGMKLSENIYRGDSLELPTALLFNSYSFSNAEIMGEGFRRLKRGDSIGERTPGYVIGTGFARMWDGGGIRLPEIGSYQIDGVDLENNGRRPDHEVWFDPDAWNAGRDVQLEKAVDVLMKQIGN